MAFCFYIHSLENYYYIKTIIIEIIIIEIIIIEIIIINLN